MKLKIIALQPATVVSYALMLKSRRWGALDNVDMLVQQ
jgi:hypothetical protein